MIKPLITEDDVLHDLLDQVFTSDAADSESALLRRARHVVELRLAFDELQTTQVPPKPGLRLNCKNADGVVPEENASTFAALVANRLAGQKNEATAIHNVSEAKTPLRTLERKVDRDDKR